LLKDFSTLMVRITYLPNYSYSYYDETGEAHVLFCYWYKITNVQQVFGIRVL